MVIEDQTGQELSLFPPLLAPQDSEAVIAMVRNKGRSQKNSQSLEDVKVRYSSQKYTLEKNTLEFGSVGLITPIKCLKSHIAP